MNKLISIEHATGYTPEQRLISAILYRAVKDLTDSTAQVRYDALGWMRKKSNKEWSFKWCCIQLDLDPKILNGDVTEEHLKAISESLKGK